MCTNVDAAVRSVEAIDGPQIVIAEEKTREATTVRLEKLLRERHGTWF